MLSTVKLFYVSGKQHARQGVESLWCCGWLSETCEQSISSLPAPLRTNAWQIRAHACSRVLNKC